MLLCIRAGSPQEEVALVEHLGKLAPTAAQLEEAGQLGELLILLGHFVDARTLQQELGKWLAQHQVSCTPAYACRFVALLAYVAAWWTALAGGGGRPCRQSGANTSWPAASGGQDGGSQGRRIRHA